MGEVSQTTNDGISRRTVTKAMAWAVPAIAIAAPVPAFAASGGPPTVTPGRAFKWPGASCEGQPGVPTGADDNKAYLFAFRIHNTSGSTIYIYGATIQTSTDLPFDVYGANPAFGTPIAPGATVDMSVWANWTSSGNLTFSAEAWVAWGHNWPGPDPDNHEPVYKTWSVPRTPTLQSQGYGGCQIPGYVAL